jgi:uncharacterized membrane protein YkvA (DUF1232 family)
MKLHTVQTYIVGNLRQLSAKVVYTVLLLYYAFHKKETPAWAKRIIVGSIAYFLTPIDAVPDLTPFFGYTDDWGVLSFGLVTIACYIDDQVRSASKEKLFTWFTSLDEGELEKVDQLL